MANAGYILIRSGPRKRPVEQPKRQPPRTKPEREKIAKAMADVYNQGLKMSKEEKINRMNAMRKTPWLG